MTANGSSERALLFDCAGDTLVGILHEPFTPSDLGVVVIVGGPQYRAGSHRQFVLLARAIANAGFAVLRFDYRGMGDSSGAARSFEHIVSDIGAAIDVLQAKVTTVRRIVLWGLCDGASAALLYVDATRDTRLAGLALLNPWVRSPASLARTNVRHYYRGRLLARGFWIKLLRGGVGLGAWREWLTNVRAQHAPRPQAGVSFQDRMAHAWASFDGDLLLVLSGDDFTAKEFIETARLSASWAGAMQHRRLLRHDLAQADHTFSAEPARAQLHRWAIHWLQVLTQSASATTVEIA